MFSALFSDDYGSTEDYGICPGQIGETGPPGKTLFQFLNEDNEDQAKLKYINEVAENMMTKFK